MGTFVYYVCTMCVLCDHATPTAVYLNITIKHEERSAAERGGIFNKYALDIALNCNTDRVILAGMLEKLLDRFKTI